MKKSILVAASVVLLAVGCTPKVARRPLTETEEQWQVFVKKYYPSWKPNATLAEALQPTVPSAGSQPAVVVRENPPTVAALPESELVFEENEAVFDASATPAEEDVVPTSGGKSGAASAAPAVGDSSVDGADKGTADVGGTDASASGTAAASGADPASAGVVSAAGTAAAASGADPAGSTYVVQKGDMLGSIAQKFYGKASLWPVIQKANADVLNGSTALKPGMKLVIPALK